ncbi:MAG: DUF4350 domain-containing protein [Anaerolineae bacterium]|nr:DUF4350 domain-containing protein [Anaerolineae bacterium]
MKLLSRDGWLAIGLLVVMVLITFAAGLQQTQGQQLPPYTSISSAPDGTRALVLWLDEIGYTVNAEQMSTFAVPGDATIALILEPSMVIDDDEWEVIDEWVEDGGSLIVAGDGAGTLLAVPHFEFRMHGLSHTGNFTLQTPLLVVPPVEGSIDVQAQAGLATERTGYITHLAAGDQPVAVSFKQGDGMVFLISAPFPFSNQGLKQPGNPAFVMATLWAAAPGGTVWFDEWHHGLRGAAGNEVVGPGQWLAATFGGRSLLYTAVIIFLAMLLQGRRFGRSVPIRREKARRTPMEHITAIANLNRRAGHRAAVMDDYRQRLKRALAYRYRLNPLLDDEEFIRTLAAYETGLNTQELGRLLYQLSKPNISENEMVDLAAKVATWLDERRASS